MSYKSLEDCVLDLERTGQLVRVKELVDPNLEMAAIQLRVYAAGGPALLFENVKGTKFRAVSNLFGTVERSRFLFRSTFNQVQQLIEHKKNPIKAAKEPIKNFGLGLAAMKALPLKNPFQKPILFEKIKIEDLPLIKHWSMDGGAFITLPQVYSEDSETPGIMKANLGMYRVQLNGNDYQLNHEIGLHYQIHRGIGVHQHKALQKGQDLKVSIFVGGPPSHSVAAVMPLPEGMSELTFAGVLGGRRFRYFYQDGYCMSADADFVITGTISNKVKPEGPFGDHLGYYSLKHDFPVLNIHQVYARKNAIWPFTVVGRPPQEDTSFGALIHELTGSAVAQEIPGLKEVHAVDAAGVHPLLLAIGKERYTPYTSVKAPAELLTIAHHILGTGQLSLAKYVFIAAEEKGLSTHDIKDYFVHVLSRVDFQRDLHFHTKATMDTLDYSGTGFNTGSKLVVAACGEPLRKLSTQIPSCLIEMKEWFQPHLVMPGVIAMQAASYKDANQAHNEMETACKSLSDKVSALEGIALIIISDDSAFLAKEFNNFLWVTFTRSNPSHDIYGVQSLIEKKHWGCKGPLVIDARIKPHHAPPLIEDESVKKRVETLFEKGGSLYGIG